MNEGGWVVARLGDIADLYQGFGFPKSLQGRTTGDFGFYKVSDISRAVAAGNEYLGPAAHCIMINEIRSLRATALPQNSVVFARIGEAIKLNRRALLPDDALVDNNVIGAKARPGIKDRYLLYFLKTVKLGELSQATTVPAVRTSDIERIEIPIAPTNEQARIVSRLDELFSRIDEGQHALDRVQKLVERYRQSVLTAAITGELTREWRERHKGQLESGKVLLARILNARRTAWEKAELEKMETKGIKPDNAKWKQKYQGPSPADATNLPELPEGWVWASLEELAAPERNAITDGPFGSNLKTLHYTADGPRVNVLFFDKHPPRADGKPNSKAVWIYDFRTNLHFTLKQNPLKAADLDDFVKCYAAGNRSKRKESDRFKRFDVVDLLKRDKLNLDIFWLKDESLEDVDSLPPPDVLAAEIVENLQAALEAFQAVAEELAKPKV